MIGTYNILTDTHRIGIVKNKNILYYSSLLFMNDYGTLKFIKTKYHVNIFNYLPYNIQYNIIRYTMSHIWIFFIKNIFLSFITYDTKLVQ